MQDIIVRNTHTDGHADIQTHTYTNAQAYIDTHTLTDMQTRTHTKGQRQSVYEERDVCRSTLVPGN